MAFQSYSHEEKKTYNAGNSAIERNLSETCEEYGKIHTLRKRARQIKLEIR